MRPQCTPVREAAVNRIVHPATFAVIVADVGPTSELTGQHTI